MNSSQQVEIMVTLGPSTRKEEDLRKLKAAGVDFVRVNLSHSNLDEFEYFMKRAKHVGIPFVIDTEGSQVRTGAFAGGKAELEDGSFVKITSENIEGNEVVVPIRPADVISQLRPDDLIYPDFGTAVLQVWDVSAASDGHITARVFRGGVLGDNKGVVIDPVLPLRFRLPVLTEKDKLAIQMGLEAGHEYVAVSFVRGARDIAEVRNFTGGKAKIISKIECVDALRNLEEILSSTDLALIDRGDLSKEILIENIPSVQEFILEKARAYGKKVFIATNLLESMILKPRPTRAEANDIVQCVLSGANGLILAGETAIGAYPIECVNVLQRLVSSARLIGAGYRVLSGGGNAPLMNDITAAGTALFLSEPHGGRLIDRCSTIGESGVDISSLERVEINERHYMDLEGIALGSFSPLEGFMNEKEIHSVLNEIRLPNGTIWPIPIFLDLPREAVEKTAIGEKILLTHGESGVLGILEIGDKFILPKDEIINKIYGGASSSHPGVSLIRSMRDWALGGKIMFFKRSYSARAKYEFSPRQTRKMFAERNWNTVIGFHTRNIPHRGHEFLQQEALRRNFCDGLLIHPVTGKKKSGDFLAEHILQSYALLLRSLPEKNIVLGSFSAYSRYAGPREAIFTAICRKNFGCTHFIVGRDHTGAGGIWEPDAAGKMFDRFPDLGIRIIKFGEIAYDEDIKKYVEVKETTKPLARLARLSGTKVRESLANNSCPPAWLVRPEISDYLISASEKGNLFVRKEGKILWFTGLSGSGKTTLVNHLTLELAKLGKNVGLVDGDVLRSSSSRHLSFSRDDIRENNRLAAGIAKAKAEKNDFVLVSLISPFREDRASARSVIGGEFAEIFIDAPLGLCQERDPKNLYKKVAVGEISNFIGVNADLPYERPHKPDLHIRTDLYKEEECLGHLLEFLKKKEWI